MLFNILSIIMVLSSILVIKSENSVHSVFFLVLVFLTSALILFLIEIEFISLLFILVYVGAIAVLFLFVVMMLDIKISMFDKDYMIYLPLGLFLGFIFFFEIYLSLYQNFFPSVNIVTSHIYTNWILSVDNISNIETLGQLLYTYYFFYFLIAGIILLIPMIGAIVLTLNFSFKSKVQFEFAQILRHKKNSVYITEKSK
uniref:NADH-ubiquinone oxidoreductase chain 6 n=1 Tax=Vischeria stellata TaxID=1104407 RepID=A0A481XJ02_9STRA|nr:NADH dehydrogenase subunit 6 [Vischeria stellata]QBK36839.1 NADH dehydrogenase subunit 6 [Vischeria stellata]